MTPSIEKLSQKNLTTLLQAMGSVSQERAAELAELDPSKLSKWKGQTGEDNRSELERFAALLAACNLQVVPRSYRAVDPDVLRATQVLAKQQLSGNEASGWAEL